MSHTIPATESACGLLKTHHAIVAMMKACLLHFPIRIIIKVVLMLTLLVMHDMSDLTPCGGSPRHSEVRMIACMCRAMACLCIHL